MKKIRIKFKNMQRGDRFVADCDGDCCIVERPRTNMDQEFQAKHRNRLRRLRYAEQKNYQKSVDKIMELLGLMS